MAPRATDTVALLEAGLTSAFSIARIGESSFEETFGATTIEPARDVFRRASRVSAQTATVLQALREATAGMQIAAIPQETDPRLPDLKTLFGSLDFCACEECQSTDGPAAYLVDLLAFVRGAVSPGGSSAALDELARRRGDLIDLELSCRNTTTELPYIDLVCEILERAAAGAAAAAGRPFRSRAQRAARNCW